MARAPLALIHTGANVHDSQQAIPLIDAIPPIKQPRGGRRRRPEKVFGDRAYDAEAKIRQALRDRGIQPLIAKRNTEHVSGLGKHLALTATDGSTPSRTMPFFAAQGFSWYDSILDGLAFAGC